MIKNAKLRLVIRLFIIVVLICSAVAVTYLNIVYYNEQLEQQYISDTLEVIDDWHDAFVRAGEDQWAYRITLLDGLSAQSVEFESGGFECDDISERFTFVLGQMDGWFFDAYTRMIDDVSVAAAMTTVERRQYVLGILSEIESLNERFDSEEQNDEGRTDRAVVFMKLSGLVDSFLADSFISDRLEDVSAEIDDLGSIKAMIEADGVITDSYRLQALNDMIDALIEAYTSELVLYDSDDVLMEFDLALNKKKDWFLNHYNGLIDLISEMERAGENDKATICMQIEKLEAVRQFIEDDDVLEPDTVPALYERIDELLGEYAEELAAIAERERLEAERLEREAAEKARQQRNARSRSSGSSSSGSSSSGSSSSDSSSSSSSSSGSSSSGSSSSGSSSSGSSSSGSSSSGAEQSPSGSGGSSVINSPGRYPNITERDREMLARLVRLEAREESSAGKQAVAEVVLNRVVSSKWNHVGSVPEVINDQTWGPQFTVAGSIWSDRASPSAADYAAVDNALGGSNVLSSDYLYFGTNPVTENDVVWIGNHAFSK